MEMLTMLKSYRRLLAVLVALVLMLAMGSIGLVASAAPGDEVTITVYYIELDYYAVAQPMFTTTIPAGSTYTETAPTIAGFDFFLVSAVRPDIPGYHYSQWEPDLVLNNVNADTTIYFCYEKNTENNWLSVWTVCINIDKLDGSGRSLIYDPYEGYELYIDDPPLFERGSSPAFTAPDIEGYEYVGSDVTDGIFGDLIFDATNRTAIIENIQQSAYVRFYYREAGATTTSTETTTAPTDSTITGTLATTTLPGTTATPKDPTPTGDAGIASVMVLATLAVGTILLVSKKRK